MPPLELALAAAKVGTSVLPFPPIVVALIAASVFIVLGFVVWSFRDVANRHSHRTTGTTGTAGRTGPADHGSEHH